MSNLINEGKLYVENHITEFHSSRLEALERLQLKRLLKRKNPYLFRAKNMLQASDLIESMLTAHLSSQEESLFGNFLERFAIHIAGIAVNGEKSTSEGIDLEFTKNNIRYVIAIKSGPN